MSIDTKIGKSAYWPKRKCRVRVVDELENGTLMVLPNNSDERHTVKPRDLIWTRGRS